MARAGRWHENRLYESDLDHYKKNEKTLKGLLSPDRMIDIETKHTLIESCKGQRTKNRREEHRAQNIEYGA